MENTSSIRRGVLVLLSGPILWLLLSRMPVHAQMPDDGKVAAAIQTWREYGRKAADQAHRSASTLPPTRKEEARSLFATAFNLANEGNLEAAQIAFERGLGIDPLNGQAEYYLANTLVKMKHVNDALPHYASAMALAPNAKEGIEAEAALRKLIPAIVAEATAADKEKARKQAADRAAAEAESTRQRDAIVRAAVEREKARVQQMADTANSCMQECQQQQRTCVGANPAPAPPEYNHCANPDPGNAESLRRSLACIDRTAADDRSRSDAWLQALQQCRASGDQCRTACNDRSVARAQ
jgi:tetratricopeptide (TPR) repeat protein